MMKYYEKENYPVTDIRYYTETVERMGILGVITTLLLALLLVVLSIIQSGLGLTSFTNYLVSLGGTLLDVILVWLVVAYTPDLIEYFIERFTNWSYDLEGGHKLVAATMLLMMLLLGYAAYTVMGIIIGPAKLLTISVYVAILYGIKRSIEALQA